MAYEVERALKSETAYSILREVARTSKGSYPQEISEKIDAHPSTISDIIKTLREEGIVQRGQRKKAQYYEIDVKGFINFANSFWEDKLQEAKSQEVTYFGANQEPDSLEPEEYFDELQPISESLWRTYILGYLAQTETSTIKNMIYADFQASLDGAMRLIHDEEELPFDYSQANLRKEIFNSLEFISDAITGGAIKKAAFLEDGKSEDFIHLTNIPSNAHSLDPELKEKILSMNEDEKEEFLKKLEEKSGET